MGSPHAMVLPFKHDDILLNLRRDTLTLLVVLAAVTSWLAILLSGLVMPITPIAAVPLWLSFEGICALTLLLKSRHVRLSSFLFIGGLYAGSVGAVLVFSAPNLLYLSLVIPLVSGILLRRQIALLITVIISIAMLLTAYPLFRTNTEPLLILWWLVLLIGFAAFDSLYRALQMILEYQAYAVEQIGEAREHRAQLMQLTRSLQETQQNLEKSNVQLRYISLAAEEARRLKAQFAANVSHELRTPINLIVGFAEIIIAGPRTYGEALPSAYWRDLNTIYRNAKHLQGLINDVLDISQIEAGRMAVVKDNTSPRDVILEATALVQDSIVHKGLSFIIEVPDNLPKAWIDRLRIRQVILNLLGNAIRFTDHGHIMVQAFTKEALLYVCVSDTGIGIPPQEIDRVFEEFHQVEGSLARRLGGSGLGLTLSKQFVELHGGRLWIESDGLAGHGSKFWLTLPLEASPALSGTFQTQRALPFVDETRQFIVLDADPSIAQLFERHTMKHHAMSVQSADAAHKLIEGLYPSALVMDINNTETLNAELVRHIPVIRCSMPSTQRYMKSLGIANYLAKPVSPEVLASILRDLNKPIHTILVVDDDQDMVRLYGYVLHGLSAGYQVRKAYSGIEALEIMRHSPPDVLILDLMMAEMGGNAVIEQMKANQQLETVSVILTSAFDVSDAVTRIAHGTIHLDKPIGFQPVELVRCVEALIDGLTLSGEP